MLDELSRSWDGRAAVLTVGCRVHTCRPGEARLSDGSGLKLEVVKLQSTIRVKPNTSQCRRVRACVRVMIFSCCVSNSKGYFCLPQVRVIAQVT